jgi:predicted enzyme related to lactoylglutathione lyase
MAVHFVQWTVDVHDVDVMARFWSQALGYRIDKGDDGSAKLYPPAVAGADAPTVWLQAGASTKRDKNRNHPDLRPANGDVDAEVERLIGIGARRADVGQSADDPFVVLADPEGNEFCVLRRDPRRPRGG